MIAMENTGSPNATLFITTLYSWVPYAVNRTVEKPGFRVFLPLNSRASNNLNHSKETGTISS
jgi:hypothetical protein